MPEPCNNLLQPGEPVKPTTYHEAVQFLNTLTVEDYPNEVLCFFNQEGELIWMAEGDEYTVEADHSVWDMLDKECACSTHTHTCETHILSAQDIESAALVVDTVHRPVVYQCIRHGYICSFTPYPGIHWRIMRRVQNAVHYDNLPFIEDDAEAQALDLFKFLEYTGIRGEIYCQCVTDTKEGKS